MVKHMHVPIPNQRSESATSHVIEEGAVRTALTLFGVMHGVDIVLQHNLLGRVVEANRNRYAAPRLRSQKRCGRRLVAD